MAWGALPARSLGDWIQFRELPQEAQRRRTQGIRGVTQMISDIGEAIPEPWEAPQLEAAAPAWMGAFTRLEILPPWLMR